jgi:tetratricopeptide (TPR) repeat protein
MSLPSVLHSLGVTILLITVLPSAALCQATKTGSHGESPTDELMNAIYVGYFLPNGMRDIMTDDGWRNIRQQASGLLAQTPNDTALKFAVAFAEGELARRSKDFTTAEAQFKMANSLDSNSALPWLALAETGLDKDDSSSVGAMLYAASFEVSKTVPPSFRHLAFTRVGELYERNGKFTEALSAYESAVKQKPGWSGGQTKLAATYLKLNQAALALPHAQEAVVLSPKDAYTHALLGQVQTKLGHSQSAVKAFQDATEIDPGNANYQYLLGLEFEGSGKRIDALHCYNTARMIAEENKSYADLLPDIHKALSRLQQ